MPHHRVPVLSALLALATPALASETTMFAPQGAPDPDAHGKLEVEKDGNQQEFRVRAFKLSTASPPGPFEVWLETGLMSGTCEFLAAMTLKSGAWELKLEADGAAPAELGVADLADLVGRHVQVRDAGGASTYLWGFVPIPGTNGCSQSGPLQKGKRDLQRPIDPPDPNASGEVELQRKGGEQEFEVEAKNLDPTAAYTVHVESGVGTESFTFVGGMALQVAALGRFKLELESECAPPVVGIADVSDLTDRKVQVRNAADQVVLQGVIPALASGPVGGNFNGNAKMTPTSGSPSPKAKGLLRVKYNAKQGSSRIDVHGSKMAPAPVCCAYIENGVGVGTFSLLGELTLNKPETVGRLRIDTKKGDPLPFGLSKASDLSGRKIRLQDDHDVVHLEGTIP